MNDCVADFENQMIKKNINIKKNNVCPAKRERCRGFVLLFAVTLAAILLSIALGVVNIVLKEIKFGTSAKDTNDAFFAADTGSECALVNDKYTSNVFVNSPSQTQIACNGNNIPVTKSLGLSFWSFIIPILNDNGQGCAIVTIDKTDPSKITIISKGYNLGSPTCDSNSANLVERQIELNY